MSTREKISLEEAAGFLETTVEMVMVELRAGRLPGIKIGKPWVIPRAAFFTAVNDRALEAARALRGGPGHQGTKPFEIAPLAAVSGPKRRHRSI